MPIAKVVEYRVALPSEQALDLLLGLGHLGMFMLSNRPPEIPSPSLPSGLAERVRRLEEVARELNRLINAHSIPHPEGYREIKLGGFREMLERALEEGEEVLVRVNQYQTAIEGVKAELETLKGVIAVLEAMGPVALGEFRVFRVDVVPVAEGDLAEFERAARSYGAEVLAVKVPGKALALVLYPTWQLQGMLTVYKIFNTGPLKLPRDIGLGEARARLVEVENKLRGLEGEFREFLWRIRERIYFVVEVARLLDDLVRRFMESAVPEGREVKEKLASLRGTLEELRSRINELSAHKVALEALTKAGVKGPELLRLGAKVAVVEGQVPREWLESSIGLVQRVNEYSVVVFLGQPPGNVGGVVRWLPGEYLGDAASSLSLVTKELNELSRRLMEVKREYEEFIKEVEEVTAFGVDRLWEAREDAVTLVGFVKAEASGQFENALANLLARLAVDARVRKGSKVVYLKDVKPERAPTLEEYPRFINAFKRLVYMYGVPKYLEVSPVPMAAILFPIFFGWMFPDIGQGLLLLAFGASLIKLRYNGPNPMLRAVFSGRFSDWGIIFVQCGLWAIAFTFIETGTFFGIPIYHAPVALTEHGSVVVESINAVLAASMITGIAALVAALVIKNINLWREGEVDVVFLFGIPLILLFTSLVLLFASIGIVPVAILIEAGVPQLLWLAQLFRYNYVLWLTILVISLAASTVGLFILKLRYRGVEGFDMARLAVEIGAEGGLASLTNTISFMRLGIIAIIHAIFTDLVVGLAKSLGLYSPLGLATLVLGNVLITLGEGFVAFIQSLRLHFYELFTKFFEGGGIVFSPLRLETKWLRLIVT